MDKKKKNQSVTAHEELEIFGRSKSSEEIREERRAEKAAQRAAAKEAAKKFREERKNQPKERRPDLWVVAGIILLVVVVCIVALAVSFARDKKLEQFERNESFETYFLYSEAYPDMTDDGLTSAVYKAYYTNGGHLCVQLLIGNGTDKQQRMDTIEVSIQNGETKELIASGYTDQVSDKFVVDTNDTKLYTFYIAPEHVKIHDDPLSTITYTVSVTGTEVE